jgi:uncharacterized alpha-E superfamily protein
VQGFLPAIAQQWLGQPLLLPALPTWWCGESAAWSDAQGQLHDKLLRSTFPRGGRTSQVHSVHDAALNDDPDAYTIQARLRFSRAPIWADGALAPRPAVVRVYAMANGQGGWTVMPGGMTRVAQREDASVSMQRGGASLDTWVLSDQGLSEAPAATQRLGVDDIAAHRRPVSSRTGENLFWLGRYTERTEQLVRLARATLAVVGTDRDAPVALRQALSMLAVRSGLAPQGVPTLVQSATLFERSVLASLGDVANPQTQYSTPPQPVCSVAFNLAALERAAQSLRDRLSTEQWRLIRSMGEGFGRALETPGGALPSTAQVMPALDQLALQLAAVTGAQTDRMTRDHGWRLLTVGRLLERLSGLALRLEVFVATQAIHSSSGTELLLDLFDSLITYRARYQRHEDLLALTDLLVLDSANPRAFAGVLRRLRTEIGKLPAVASVGQGGQSATQLLALLPEQGAGLTLESLRDADAAALNHRLQALATAMGAAAAQVADRVSGLYFDVSHDLDHPL